MATLEREISREQAQLLFDVSSFSSPRFKLVLIPQDESTDEVAQYGGFQSEEEAIAWMNAGRERSWDIEPI